MNRSSMMRLLMAAVGLAGTTQALGGPACAPVLTLGQVDFSPMREPALERRWTAVVSVDASRCPANATGAFAIVFTRAKENAPEVEFRQQFIWAAPAVMVAVDFAPDEAVARYRVDTVAPCPCGG